MQITEGDCVEVCCVPSATTVLRLHGSQNELSASDCVLLYILQNVFYIKICL